MDACFRLCSKDRGVKNDPELGPGWSYSVDHRWYYAEIDKHPGEDEASLLSRLERRKIGKAFDFIRKAHATPRSKLSRKPPGWVMVSWQLALPQLYVRGAEWSGRTA